MHRRIVVASQSAHQVVTCMCTHMHTCTHAHMQPQMQPHVHACTRTCACTRKCTHAHVHTYTHAHMHTYTHAHMRTRTHTHTRTHAHSGDRQHVSVVARGGHAKGARRVAQEASVPHRRICMLCTCHMYDLATYIYIGARRVAQEASVPHRRRARLPRAHRPTDGAACVRTDRRARGRTTLRDQHRHRPQL